ncbi:MAG TPA: thermonuclease family protein [Aggregatilineaceae bacterium]|nr:thermonuclease family protein [Aggregatilineaceae bacterium]
MAAFRLNYTPEHLKLGDEAKWISSTDGDTPTIQIPVRMLGIDAPELHYEGASENNPGKFDDPLAAFLDGPGQNLNPGLREYLAPRLGNKASTRHIKAGAASHQHFEEIVKTRLDRGLGKNGKPLVPRKLFIMVAEEVFDKNGRMLAYVNANYSAAERKSIPAAQRPTFNLQMLQDGHATSLLIYPNVPKPDDLKLVQAAVSSARQPNSPKGLWAQGEQTLLAYEFRWIVDTISGARQGPDRFCGDVQSGALYEPQLYYLVEPENRLFFYGEDVGNAYSMGFRFSGY